MTLLENWRNKAYGDATDDRQKEEIWKNYFIVEKGIYESILKNPKDVIKCTVAELATKFYTDIQTITGFLDGINDSLNKPNPIEEMKEGTVVKEKKIGRNDPCPCGSGKKYKFCCGKN